MNAEGIPMDAEQQQSMEAVSRLADDELTATVQRLLTQERRVSASLLMHLAEVDARELYRRHACSSMFDYCVQQLHLSESEAYLRIRAARLGRQFPRVLQMLAAGELHLSAVKLLAPFLTQDNCERLLCTARLKSKREVELLLAQFAPQPDVPNVIRKLPQQVRGAERPSEAQTALLSTVSNPSSEQRALALQSSPAAKFEPRSGPLVPPAFTPIATTLRPLGPSRFKVQLTASQQLHDKLRQARDLLRHELPDGDLAQVLERALDLLIAQRMKGRFAQSSKPRARREDAPPKPDSRHVPNEVRRAVLERDGMRCSYVSAEGKRCEQCGWLELHHEHPYGRGGAPTVANIRVLCRAHNDLLAERDYGRDFMQRRIERARAGRRGKDITTRP
jgi:hypothetical protein